jgi:glycosyltransferase involved in cell wall biosynthesis
MKERYKSNGVQVEKFVLPVAGMQNEFAYEKLVADLERQIINLGPDLVHGNTVQSYHILAVAARNGIPTLWNIRESDNPESYTAGLHTGARQLFDTAREKVAQYVFVSRASQALWQESRPEITARTIRNGVDSWALLRNYRTLTRKSARALFEIEDHELVIFNVGTWTDRKGQRDIVQALPFISRRLWPRLRVLLIGANATPYAKQILDDVDDLPLSLKQRVSIYPETHERSERARILAAYKAADIFVFTSRIESYPRVINEAMFFGLPIISTPCFGVVEQIEPGVSGVFYDAGDTAKLANAVERLITMPGERESLGKMARWSSEHRVMQYQDMVEQYAQAYGAMING